jgi:hypothetical protein
MCCRGVGDYTRCQTLMRQGFNKSSCSSTSNCSFDGVYQPVPISSSLKFIGMSALYTTFQTLAPNIPLSSNSNGNFDLSTINLTQIQNAIRTVCNQSWLNLSSPDTKYRPCKSSIFHIVLILYL